MKTIKRKDKSTMRVKQAKMAAIALFQGQWCPLSGIVLNLLNGAIFLAFLLFLA